MVLVWEATVDTGKFKCSVERTGDRTGILKVKDVGLQKVLLEQSVGLSYGALYGPDADDVRYWQELSINAIDRVEE